MDRGGFNNFKLKRLVVGCFGALRSVFFKLKRKVVYAWKNRKSNAIYPVASSNPVNNVVIVPTTSARRGTSVAVLTSPDCENGPKRCERKEHSIFRSILFLALLIGVPISPAMLFPYRKWLNYFLRKWNITVFYIRTVLLVIECFSNHLFWPSLAQRYSIHGGCLAGYVIILIFRVKRREVETALWEMTHLSSELHPRGVHPLLRCCEFVCFLGCVSYFSLGTHFLWFVWWDFTFQRILSESPLPEDSEFFYAYAWVLNLALILTYHIGALTLCTTTILCSRSYMVSSEFIRLFGEKLRKDVSERPLGTQAASRNLNLFQRIFTCVRAIDDVFSVCAAVVCVDVINNYYVVLSTLLSGQEKYGTMGVLLPTGTLALVATLKFLYLTLSGDQLRARHVTLKNDLIEMSDSVVRKSSKLGAYRFAVITANIRTVDVHVTGMGYFKLTRGIIPSAISALITYGVTIYQMGAIDDLD